MPRLFILATALYVFQKSPGLYAALSGLLTELTSHSDYAVSLATGIFLSPWVARQFD